MARARKYGWNGELPAKSPVGQQQVVLAGMGGDLAGEMKTAHEWTELIGPNLATRQDPYRVVLYYILGLKKAGCIKTAEFDIDAVTTNGETKHAVTVRTNSEVEERFVELTDPNHVELQAALDNLRVAQEA